jgi:hypothetical protein
VAVTWERKDLESLLRQTEGAAVTLSFDRAVLEQALDEDVEAHGLRERALVLTVAAATAASTAGAVQAAVDPAGGGAGGQTQAYAIEDVRAGQPAPEATSAGGEGITISAPSPAEAAGLAGAAALAIAGAAFAVRSRRRPQPT